jgi:DNA polymerase I
MSTVKPTTQERREVPVDIKKVDYTIQNYEEENALVEELQEVVDDPDKPDSDAAKVIDELDEYNAPIKPVMHIKGRAQGGSRVHIRVHGARPYFYVPADELDESLENDDKVTGVDKGHENIKGERMVKVYTRIPGDVPKLRGDYDHHEADILFPNRFMIDAGIEGSISVPHKHATPEPTDIHVDDIGDADYDEETRVCYCDIEVDDSKGFPDQERAERRVISITVYDNYVEDYQIFLYDPDFRDVSHEEAKVRQFTSEAGMLRGFMEYMHTRDFDAIAGWNFTDFDSRYLINRLEYLNEHKDVDSIEKSDLSPLGSAYDDGWFGAKIKGIAVFDLLRAYKNLQFTELDSYSLEDVAQAELGTGKVDHDEGLYELWQDDPQQLVDYNVKDVKLTVMLDEEQEIIKFYEEIANYVGGRTAECVDASKAVDIKILRAVSGVFAVPSAKNVDGEAFEGAQVFDPITGVKENVVVLDLASLYPMSMKTINAGPETKDPDGELVAPNDVRFNNDEDAIVVEIIDELLETRQKYKDLRDKHSPNSRQYEIYDRKQSAVKVVMNTLYGVMGWDRFRLYDEDVGAAVTAVGREVIRFTEQVVEEMGYEVTYGDTDSVMLELGPDVDTEEAKEIAFEIEDRINERYNDFAKEELNADEHFFDIEFEKLYRRYFQAGKKKRYAGHIVWKEGKDKDDIDTVGFETERSDYSQAAKDILEQVLEIIVRGGGLDQVSEHVRTEIDKLRNGEYNPDYWGIPSSVTKNFDDYDSPTLAVRASKYANEALDAGIQPGDKPKMMYVERVMPDDTGNVPYDQPPSTSEGNMAVCWMSYNDIPDSFRWNWDAYVEKQIKRPVQRVLSGTDWTWTEVISGKRQPKLGEYDFESVDEDDEVIEASFSEDDEEEPFSDDFESQSNDGGEMNEQQARAALMQTQEFLDDFEPEEPDEGEVVEADMKDREPGPADLSDYL